MGYTHYIKSVDSPSSLEDALKVRTSDGFSNFQGAGKPYKIGHTVKSKDIDGTWALAVRRVNKQLGTNYKFVVRSVYGGDGQYFSYVLNNK